MTSSLLYHDFVQKEFWRVHEKFDAKRRNKGRYVDLKCMRATGHPAMKTCGRVSGSVGQEDEMVSVLYEKAMSFFIYRDSLGRFQTKLVAHIILGLVWHCLYMTSTLRQV